MTLDETNIDLDMTLPEELRNLVRYGGALDLAKAEAELKSGPPQEPSVDKQGLQKEATDMAGENTNTIATAPKIHTEDQIRAIANETITALAGQKDRETALAAKISEFVSEKNEANRALASSIEKNTTLTAEVETLKAEAKKAKAEKDTSDTNNGKIIKDFDKAKADLTEATAKLMKVTADKTVADRKAKLAKKKMKAESNFGKKACATKDDFSMDMTDAEFEDRLGDFDDVDTTADVASAEAAKKAKAKTDKDTDGGQENDGGKLPGAKAKASDTPAEPNLNGVDQMALAHAALLNGGVAADVNLVDLYTKTFKAG